MAKASNSVEWVKSDAAIEGEVIMVSQLGRVIKTYRPSDLGPKYWDRVLAIREMEKFGPR